MAFKLFVLAAVLAAAQAGGPAAYSTLTQPIGYGSIGTTHEQTIKGLGGNNVISQYSKAVDTAYSSVRKYDTRISNDAVAIGAAPALAYGNAYGYGGSLGLVGAPALRTATIGLAAPAIRAAPALAYGGAYGYGSSLGLVGAPALRTASIGLAAPAYRTVAAAPAVSYANTVRSPVVAAQAISAAPIGLSGGLVGVGSPALAYGNGLALRSSAIGVAQPLALRSSLGYAGYAGYAGSPALAYGNGLALRSSAIGVAQPLALQSSLGYAASPALAYGNGLALRSSAIGVAQPLALASHAVAAAPLSTVSHVSYSGLGASYAW